MLAVVAHAQNTPGAQKTYAQALVDREVARHPDLLGLALYVTRPDTPGNVIIASNDATKLGRKAGSGELAGSQTIRHADCSQSAATAAVSRWKAAPAGLPPARTLGGTGAQPSPTKVGLTRTQWRRKQRPSARSSGGGFPTCATYSSRRRSIRGSRSTATRSNSWMTPWSGIPTSSSWRSMRHFPTLTTTRSSLQTSAASARRPTRTTCGSSTPANPTSKSPRPEIGSRSGARSWRTQPVRTSARSASYARLQGGR